MAYYTGEGKHIKVPQTETYLSEEMAVQIPEELRTFRYDTYVGKGAVVSANKRGIYGLMNEFTAYCWDTITNNSMYEYYLTQELTEENWLNYQAASIMLIRSLSTTSFHTCCMQRKITPTYTSRR